jgi:outer membrane lipoprotein carrier protein
LNASQYPGALASLGGSGSLTREYRIRSLDAAKLGFVGGHVLECEPVRPHPAYRRLLLYVDGRTTQVRRVLILDAQGNRNRFDFEVPELNPVLRAGEFSFTPPAGTQWVEG